MAKVFITGISGFIGSYLAERLIDEGFEVGGFLRQSNRLNYPSVQRLIGRVTMHYGSLVDYPAIRWALADFQPDYICHLGAVTPVAYSFDHPHEIFQTNYAGTVNMVEAALKECPDLKKFIYASSMEVYGYINKREPFRETDDPKPASPYGVAKLAAEKYLQFAWYAYGFPAVAFRQTNCFGRRENDYFVVEAIVTQMLKGNSINLGDPRPVRNFIYVDDLVDLYLEVLTSDRNELLGEVFNTGPDNGISIEELAKKIASLMGWEGRINWYTRPKRVGEVFYLNSSPEKIKRASRWEPKIDLTTGLLRTIEIWDANLNSKRT